MLSLEKTIGRKIAKERKNASLTQAELAEKIEISEKYLSRIECGIQIPSIIGLFFRFLKIYWRCELFQSVCNILNNNDKSIQKSKFIDKSN